MWKSGRSYGASLYPLSLDLELWTTLVSIHGGDWICLLRVKELMLGWIRLPLRKKDSKLWKVAPLCLLWVTWKERNNVIFEDDAKVLFY